MFFSGQRNRNLQNSVKRINVVDRRKIKFWCFHFLTYKDRDDYLLRRIQIFVYFPPSTQCTGIGWRRTEFEPMASYGGTLNQWEYSWVRAENFHEKIGENGEKLCFVSFDSLVTLEKCVSRSQLCLWCACCCVEWSDSRITRRRCVSHTRQNSSLFSPSPWRYIVQCYFFNILRSNNFLLPPLNRTILRIKISQFFQYRVEFFFLRNRRKVRVCVFISAYADRAFIVPLPQQRVNTSNQLIIVTQRTREARYTCYPLFREGGGLLLVMATSSSDGSCTAPADFQLSSELEDVTSRLSLNLLKCPLCYNSRRIFYCRQCIQNGDFVHSTSVYSER